MIEVVIVPTYKRNEELFYCLSMIRAFEPNIPIVIFPDRGTADDPDFQANFPFTENMFVQYVPKHSYHGNSYNAMEAFRAAYNSGAERVFYIEDDVIVHPDFFKWHREIHEEMEGDIFASMAWVFNRYAPLVDDILFQPWYYAIGTCFARPKLGLIARHASPLYYQDMQGYIEKEFRGSKMNTPFGIEHFEQDGLIQRILDVDKTQTVTAGIAKCTHIGMHGYNRGWSRREEFFDGCKDFAERLAKLSAFVADPYARAQVFDREIVEREIGKKLPPRKLKYKVELPDGWSTEFTSELERGSLPRRINSVHLPSDAEIVLES